MNNTLKENCKAHMALFETALGDPALQSAIVATGEAVIDTLGHGGKLLLCGNGGSASDAAHIAAEFVGSFCAKTKPLPAIALTVNTAVLTALANDFGYESVFSKQVEALACKNDLVIGLSTSGKSENVLRALQTAHQKGAKTMLLCGENLPQAESDFVIAVPSDDTARIQEMHLFIGHCLAQYVKEYFTNEEIHG